MDEPPTVPSGSPRWPPVIPKQPLFLVHWRNSLVSAWNSGIWPKIAFIAAIPLIVSCLCCGGFVAWAASPAGQEFSREVSATETVQAVYAAQAHATATAYTLAHPKPTATPQPTADSTATQEPTATPAAQPTATGTPKPAPQPTATKPPPPAPTPTKPPCAVNCNPWGYNFSCCNYIYSPPSNFCSYFACIANFWNGTGYVMECQDGMYSKSGGHSGSCSYHGGNWRALLAP